MIRPYKPRLPGLGDLLASKLAAIGITEDRASRLARKLGLRGCFCGNARRWLNRQGWLHKIVNRLGLKVRYHDRSIW